RQPLASAALVCVPQWSRCRYVSRAASPIVNGMVGSLMPCDDQYGIGLVSGQVVMISPDMAAIARNVEEMLQPTLMVMMAPMLKPVANSRDWSTQSWDSNRVTMAVTKATSRPFWLVQLPLRAFGATRMTLSWASAWMP